jgi:hypothetical protein
MIFEAHVMVLGAAKRLGTTVITTWYFLYEQHTLYNASHCSLVSHWYARFALVRLLVSPNKACVFDTFTDQMLPAV